MGAMDKFLGLMNINRQDDEYEDDYAEDDDGYVEGKQHVASDFEPEPEESKVRTFERERKPIAPPQPFKKRTNTTMVNNDVSVKVYKPKGFEEAREIAEDLLDNKIIVLNFEGADISVAQRVLDVITGACIAINGKLQKMSSSLFIATPENVDITGEYLASQLDI